MSAECFWCDGTASGHYHPTCAAPGCSADVHGHGEDGKTVYNYCSDCRGGS